MGRKPAKTKPLTIRLEQDTSDLIDMCMEYYSINRTSAIEKLIGFGSPYFLNEYYNTQEGVNGKKPEFQED